MIIQTEGVIKSFGANMILKNISVRVADGDRIGLIGANGAGKTTLLNIINGDLMADEGTISVENGRTIGFLRQSGGLDETGTIYSEMRSVFAILDKMEADMRLLEDAMGDTPVEAPAYESLSQEYSSLQNRYELGEGYQIKAKIEAVLNGMGFGDVNRETPIDVLSGGEKTRLALCKLLLEEPDLLILDEPTNHLDFPTLLWLEDYLISYRGAMLIVSHDRFFLDRICGIVWELEHRRLETYKSNYTKYLTLKKERMDFQIKEYEKQQEVIADYKDFIARNLVRASTTKRAQSRQKALDRMDMIEAVKAPPKPPQIRFEVNRRPVSDILELKDISLSVGENSERKHLFDGLNLHIKRGEKLAIVGRNGIGKSSLLSALQNNLAIDSGSITWGRNTDLGYFEQGEGELQTQKTVIQELWDEFPREIEHTIRTTLGHAGLRGEAVFKQVGKLSGGEKARLKFSKLMLKKANVLIMDEPTNHLDLPTKEVLDEALSSYEGTLIVVSHDRYLLNKFPDKIVEMDAHGATIYEGTYNDYASKKAATQEKSENSIKEAELPSKSKSGYKTKEDRRLIAQRRQNISNLETEAQTLEEEIKELGEEVHHPDVVADYQVLGEKYEELDERQFKLSAVLEEWTILLEEQEQEENA